MLPPPTNGAECNIIKYIPAPEHPIPSAVVYTCLLCGQAGLAACAQTVARLLARVRSHHELVCRLEVRAIGIIVGGHILRQQLHHNLTARRREHVRHIGRVRAVAQTAALE